MFRVSFEDTVKMLVAGFIPFKKVTFKSKLILGEGHLLIWCQCSCHWVLCNDNISISEENKNTECVLAID